MGWLPPFAVHRPQKNILERVAPLIQAPDLNSTLRGNDIEIARYNVVRHHQLDAAAREARAFAAQCLGQSDELLHPQGVRVHLEISHFAEPHVKQGLMRAFESLARRQTCEFGHIPHEPNPAHVSDKGIVLRHVADRLADPRFIAIRIQPKHMRRALRWPMKPQQRIDQSGFPRAIWTEQPDGAAPQLTRESVQHGAATEPDLQSVEINNAHVTHLRFGRLTCSASSTRRRGSENQIQTGGYRWQPRCGCLYPMRRWR